MDALKLKRKMFEEMGEVAKADGAEAIRSRHAPPPIEEISTEEGAEMADSEEVPGMSDAEGEAGPAPGGEEDSLEALLAGMSEEELMQLLASKQ